MAVSSERECSNVLRKLLNREQTKFILRIASEKYPILAQFSDYGPVFLAAVPPQGARIVTPEQPMTAGRTYTISCVVWGSNPPARVEWYRGDRQDMKPIKVSVGRLRALNLCIRTEPSP